MWDANDMNINDQIKENDDTFSVIDGKVIW